LPSDFSSILFFFTMYVPQDSINDKYLAKCRDRMMSGYLESKDTCIFFKNKFEDSLKLPICSFLLIPWER
jgi:hypothetical protein